MLKRLLSILLLFFIGYVAQAAHIKGGFFNYEYITSNTSGTTATYRIRLTVYMQCNPSEGQLTNPINFSIFDGVNFTFVKNVEAALVSHTTLSKNFDNPCISGDERGCYYSIIQYDAGNIDLPVNTNGYIVSYQRCCRIAGITNVINSGREGNTFAIKIPGGNFYKNSSPNFLVNDTAVVCRNSSFEIPFILNDPDNDSLTYEFCSALSGGSQQTPAPITAQAPPYGAVPYSNGFSGVNPLGSSVTIDRVTGTISGIAPAFDGEYVISICVNEYDRTSRVFKAQSQKELHLVIRNCDVAEVNLEKEYISCDDFIQSFTNLTPSSLIKTYLWNFGDPASGNNNTSTIANPTHTFTDTGVYTIKVVTNRGDACPDSSTAIVRVFPGFNADFSTLGTCYLNPIQFSDQTTATYGVVNKWMWNFGEADGGASTKDASWKYSTPGAKDVSLVVSSSKGCIDTVYKKLDLFDKPALDLAFRDTLICNGDILPLQASGFGTFTWTPNINISNINIPNPIVHPTTTTTYNVTLEESGCFNTDSVKVRVVDFVTLIPMQDTVICATDTIQLHVNSNGLQYSWTPVNAFEDATVQNPFAINGGTNIYNVTATIGGCQASASINVNAVPYPIANAGLDTTICYNVPVLLNGSHNGASFTWSPAQYLTDPTILNPLANPPFTTPFILASYDTLGCPKPGYDTVIVNVLPQIFPYAGNDTAVVVNQPLQFNATGGTSYLWTPNFQLNDATIGNPIAIYAPEHPDTVRYTVEVFDEFGCSEKDDMLVKIFKTVPTVFVPTGFTPNGDGLNDVIAPIAVGMQRINYFKIFNRWGDEVFSTSENGIGWDGTIKGKPQSSNAYVWMVSAVDYLGNPYTQKGTLVLIR